MGEMTVLLMAATAMVLALLFFWLSARSRKRTGIPAGEVFYQDLVGQPFEARNLRSLKLGISGKPDCLIRTADGIVPVELKKSKRPPARGEVYPNHMIQNLAYCALVEEQLRERVPYGLVIYASGTTMTSALRLYAGMFPSSCWNSFCPVAASGFLC